MAHSFITNKDRLLSDIITGILPKSDAVDILVGYFYFSGYIQLTDKLTDKHLRILVGLDIDTQISNRVREVEELMEWQRIRSKVREEYFNNLMRLIKETDITYDEVLIVDSNTPITREEYDNLKTEMIWERQINLRNFTKQLPTAKSWDLIYRMV